jgi:uncharacterized protein YqeY
MSSQLKERLRSDLNEARKQRDKFRTLLLTTTLSELKNREIEILRAATDEDVVDVIGRAIKRRREAADQIRAGGRHELAEKEEQEARLLSAYLPPALSEEDVRNMIRELIAAGAANVGAVMGQLAPRIKGRFDAREANRMVREELG